MGWGDVLFIFGVAFGAQAAGELYARHGVDRARRAAVDAAVVAVERNLAAAERAVSRARTGANVRAVEALTAEAARLAAVRAPLALWPALAATLFSTAAAVGLAYLYAGVPVAALPFDPTWGWPRGFFCRGLPYPPPPGEPPAASYLPFFVLANAPAAALKTLVMGPTVIAPTGGGSSGGGGDGAGGSDLARLYAQASKQAEKIVGKRDFELAMGKAA